LEEAGINAEILDMMGRVRSVAEASSELDLPPDNFIKTIVFASPSEEPILAIVRGTDRASSRRIGVALEITPPLLATPDVALKLTGYEVGGMPPVSIPNAHVLIDPRVMELQDVVGGGGTERHLLRISPEDILKATNGLVVRIRR
ncbi:MAG: aminoacyl-tRNA deacylase, partial [Candidatus Hodarchaeota archaeon]